MYRTVKISDFLHRVKDKVKLAPEKEYSLVTIKLHHKGIILREKKKGSLIKSNMYRIKEGQFILSGIDARNGAFGIIPKELDGAIVTNDFWYFNVDENIVKKEFFYWFTNTPLFKDACIKSSKGETQRIRLQSELFNNFEFHIPPIEQQESFLKKILHTDKHLGELKLEIDYQESLLNQLRQSILQEASEGRLTAKWRKKNSKLISGENGAEKLLEKIKTDKEKLFTEGKIKKEKPLPPISDEEKPFDLPEGWVWCRLGEISSLITSGSRGWAKYYSDSGRAKFIRMGNLSNNSYSMRLKKIQRVEPPLNGEGVRTCLEESDILISITGDVGWLGIVPPNFGEAYINQHTGLLRLMPFMQGFYIPNILLSPFSKKQFEHPQRGIKNSFRLSDISEHIIPLPPLDEQNEIVRKVNSLNNIIDFLNEEINNKKHNTDRLMQSILKEAFES